MLFTWLKKNYTTPELVLFGIVACYMIGAYVLLTSIGRLEFFSISMYTVLTTSLAGHLVLLLIGLRCAYVMIKIRPDALFLYFYQDLKSIFFSKKLLLTKLPVFFLILMFNSVFGGVKVSMPFLAEYRWDGIFATLDRSVHFGFEPWFAMSGILNQPEITFFFSLVYYVWFFAMFGFLFWQTFDLRNFTLRMQFLLSFVITWILLGNVFAVMFASGGHAFFIFLNPP